MSESKPKRAVIIGGSMSGLLSGLMLRRSGWDVDIYERVESELSGRGAGIVAQPELMQRLRRLGLEPEGLGVHIGTRKILDAQGRITTTIECSQIATAWERVYRLLRDAFPTERYHRGHIFVKFTQTPEAVTAHFSEGETFTADVLVGADGIRSTVRQQCLPTVQPRYAGYSAWRALIPEEARPPLNKQGETLIRFTISSDGHITAMNLDGSSQDTAIDRACWGGITGVGQFPPLPANFKGPSLELRIDFLTNKPLPY